MSRTGTHLVSAWLIVAALTLAVCPAQTLPQPATPAAKVIQLVGQVSVLRDSQPWALSVGDAVQVRQVIVTGPDGMATFEVSDGSTFDIYPNSRVTFRNNPGDWKDLLDMWMGRIRVHIQKLGGMPNHNRVRTPTAVISVRGTIFDVALEDELDTTLVSVEEGQVAVQHALLPRGEPKLINAGEYIRVYKDQPLAKKLIDKGSAVREGLRAVVDAFYTLIYRSSGRVAGRGPIPGGGTGGPTVPGDTGATPPPPPPPPPGDPSATPPPPPPGS